jgi:lysophospholipase L1-like esterase
MHRLHALLGQEAPVTWVFTGDSITHGALHTLGWRDYTELFRERVVWELQRRHDCVINTAFSGYRVGSLLEEYDRRIGRFAPDVVFVMIGMNDCLNGREGLGEFREQLSALASRMLDAGSLPVLQTTCPVIAGKAPGREEHLPAYMEAVRQVAASLPAPCIDHYGTWTARSEQVCYYLMSDPFHPNECGHRAFAHLLFRAAGIWDDAAYTCRLFVP